MSHRMPTRHGAYIDGVGVIISIDHLQPDSTCTRASSAQTSLRGGKRRVYIWPTDEARCSPTIQVVHASSYASPSIVSASLRLTTGYRISLSQSRFSTDEFSERKNQFQFWKLEAIPSSQDQPTLSTIQENPKDAIDTTQRLFSSTNSPSTSLRL